MFRKVSQNLQEKNKFGLRQNKRELAKIFRASISWKTFGRLFYFYFFIFSEALALLTQALEFHTRNYGTGHPIVADAMCRVSYVYQVVGEYVLILICDSHL